MIVTIQPTLKNPEKQVFEFSKIQAEALADFDRFDSLEAAQEALDSKQATMILRALVNKGLFKVSATGIYTRTALGSKVAAIVAERVG